MATLRELLGESDKRSAVIDDALRVLDAEVADKRGLAGIGIKTAFKIVKGLGADFLRKVVDHLLNDFLDALDPIYQEALQQNRAPGVHLRSDPSRVANALLSITDVRARNADNRMIRKAYEKLRGIAQKQVEAAAPRLGQLLDRHTA